MAPSVGTAPPAPQLREEPRQVHDLNTPTTYPVDERMRDRIERDFTYHPVDGEQAQRMAAIRDDCKALATKVVETTPPGREQALALTALEQVSMMANAAIARHE